MRAWAIRILAGALAMCAAPNAGVAQTESGNTQPGIERLAQARIPVPRAPTAASSGELNTVAKINSWTVGLAAGLPEGTFLRFTSPSCT
jgi:hypothetical protein